MRLLFALTCLLIVSGPLRAEDRVLTYGEYWQLNKTQPADARAYAVSLVRQVFEDSDMDWPCVQGNGEVVPDDLIYYAFDVDAYGRWSVRTDRGTLGELRTGEIPPPEEQAKHSSYLSAGAVFLRISPHCQMGG